MKKQRSTGSVPTNPYVSTCFCERVPSHPGRSELLVPKTHMRGCAGGGNQLALTNNNYRHSRPHPRYHHHHHHHHCRHRHHLWLTGSKYTKPYDNDVLSVDGIILPAGIPLGNSPMSPMGRHGPVPHTPGAMLELAKVIPLGRGPLRAQEQHWIGGTGE